MPLSLVIQPDGITRTENFPTDDQGLLKAMYEAIGGNCIEVELVALTDQFDMWVDADGLHTQPPNTPATLLAQRFGLTWQTYRGTAIVTAPETPTGRSSLSEPQVALLENLITTA